MMDNRDLLRRAGNIARRLRRAWGGKLCSVVAFGSRVRGDEHEESDLDLLIVADHFPVIRSDRFRPLNLALRGLSAEYLRPFSIIPLPTAFASNTKPYYIGILEAHRILYDRDGFFKNVLERLKLRMKALGSYKAWTRDGLPYWVLVRHYDPNVPVIL